jgi:hypothetical protein
MEENKKEIIIEYSGNHPEMGDVRCKIKIKDGMALHVFSNAKYAKYIYMKEKEVNPKIIFQERLNAYAEKFDGETKEKIAEYFMIKLKEHNAKIK